MNILVVGEDFRFGRDREGDLAPLRREAAGRFTLIQAPDVEIGGCRVASSLIRRQLAAGSVREAGLLLEKPYFIDGKVVRGAGRGRWLGFPTLNIASDNAILPPGVFHTRVDISGRSYPRRHQHRLRPHLRRRRGGPPPPDEGRDPCPRFPGHGLRQKCPPAFHRQDPRREEIHQPPPRCRSRSAAISPP